MLVDEDGCLKELPINLLASFLYGMNEHNDPILGDILLVGEYINEEMMLIFVE